jgi:phage shock protein C
MSNTDPFRSPNPHRLYKIPYEGRIAGVCAGIADFLSVKLWVVRLGFVLGLIFFTLPFLLGYLILALALTAKPRHLYRTQDEEQFWRSVTIKPDATLAALRAKFRDLDRQVGSMEGFVASKEYDLRRQFRDLER